MFVRYRERPDSIWGGTGMIRAFVFDLDGTLVETEELKALSYARAATALRPDLNEGEVIAAFGDLVGLSRQEVAVGLMRRFGLEEAARARMAEFGGQAVAGLRPDQAWHLRGDARRPETDPGAPLSSQHSSAPERPTRRFPDGPRHAIPPRAGPARAQHPGAGGRVRRGHYPR